MPPTSFLKWKFVDPYDPTLANTYVFSLNPNQMTSPFPNRNITTRGTTAINGRTLVIEGQRQPTQWTFSGDFLEPNHLEALRSWVLDRTGRKLLLYDHFGRELTVVPTGFSAIPKRAIGRYWRHTYEITCLVLDIKGGTFKLDPPTAPRQVAVTGKYERATVTFQPPLSSRGAATLFYTITNEQTGETHRVNAGDPLVDYWDKIGSGNRSFHVTASSTAGESAPSASASAFISAITGPMGVQITSATATYDTATIRFTGPSDDGGSPLLGFTVKATEVGTTSGKGVGTWSLPADARTFTFKNLATFGNSYDLSVAGVNARDTGPAATKQIKTLVASGPSAPVITNLVATKDSIKMDWTDPVRDGGLPLRDFYVVLESFVGGNNGDAYTQGISLSTHSWTFNGLRPGLLYRASVYATNNALIANAGVTGQNIKTIMTLKG